LYSFIREAQLLILISPRWAEIIANHDTVNTLTGAILKAAHTRLISGPHDEHSGREEGAMQATAVIHRQSVGQASGFASRIEPALVAAIVAMGCAIAAVIAAPGGERAGVGAGGDSSSNSVVPVAERVPGPSAYEGER
jgi:hypothetical protein